jgi:hypothetical protein
MVGCERQVVAAILQSGTNAATAFTQRRARRADRMKIVLTSLDSRNIDLNLDKVGIDNVNRSAECLIKYGF